MAISYSYPMGTPKLTDTVLGVQYEEMKDPAVKNFSIDDIVALAVDEVVTPTLQQVTGEGANTTIQMQINGVNVATLNDLSSYVPYTGATGSINIGSNDIYTAGGAKLADDGSIYGTELYLYDGPNNAYGLISVADDFFILRRSNETNMITCDNGSSFTINNGDATATIVNPLTVSRNYTLPDATGTLALTSDIPTPAYKVYRALITANGANPPIVIVLENTIGTINVDYVQTGVISLTSTALFTTNKTAARVEPQNTGMNYTFRSITPLSDSYLSIASGTHTAGSVSPITAQNMFRTYVEVLVYL